MTRTHTQPLYLHDRSQVKALLAGDEDAFTRFFEENYSRLYRFALPRLHGEQDAAEDIAQQTLATALQKLSMYRGEAQLYTWLCSICRNLVTDWLRKQGRYRSRVVLIEDYPEIQAAVDSFSAPAADDPMANLHRTELARLIQVALDQLSPKYGDVLEWKYLLGYSVQEIADRLNTSIDATQSLLTRAKKAFTAVYGPLTDTLVAPSHQS